MEVEGRMIRVKASIKTENGRLEGAKRRLKLYRIGGEEIWIKKRVKRRRDEELSSKDIDG